MKYYKLGKLPRATVNFFLEELLKIKIPILPYQWIHFNEHLHNEFLKIFTNTELKIQKSPELQKPIQKAFYSEHNYGYTIHKDGTDCQSALNIAISCNPGDWVRWYDEDYINSLSTLKIKNNSIKGKYSSRDTDIKKYEEVPFTDELKNEIGDVYVLDVGSYHSFKCIGNKPRIIIQTKFKGFPDLETIYDSLKKNSFSNIETLKVQ